VVLEGARRALDYQDPDYATLFIERLERIAALDALAGNVSPGTLTEATARALALWMTFEDPIRVADLKVRATRFQRVRDEIQADPGQLFGITDFLRPRVSEIAGTLPAGLGSWVVHSPRVIRWLTRWTGGRRIRAKSVSGFLMLYMLASLRRWRRGTLRFREENARIETWLSHIAQLATTHYGLAVEFARAQRLIKGYGETHERGWRSFCAITEQLEVLRALPDGAPMLARLQEAALADEEGTALAREIAALNGPASEPAGHKPVPARERAV
jgi:indolepyruvate ferredoxin oxidoreductase beta subunit